MEIKSRLSLFFKHSAPIGLFLLLPILVVYYLGNNLIDLEKEKHLSSLSGNILNYLTDIKNDSNPETFALKLGRGAWYTFCNTKDKLEDFWQYYRQLNRYLKAETDIYLFDEKGKIQTPSEFPLKSKFIASKLWETIDSSYALKTERASKMKKQFKTFLGNEFKLGKFLEGRNRVIPIILNTKVGYIYWMNNSNKPKEGILVVFWEMPALEFRLTQMAKRHEKSFTRSFLRTFNGQIIDNSLSQNFSKKSMELERVYINAALLGNQDNYIDSEGILWRSSKINENWLFGGLKSKVLLFNKAQRLFVIVVIILFLVAAALYTCAIKNDTFYLSIKVKLVGLFLIAVLIPVLAFAYLGYQYVEDMEQNLISTTYSESSSLLTKIDRELGASGNAFRDDFRKIVEDYRKYENSIKIQNDFEKSLEDFELGVIERRSISDASIITQITNQVIFEGMSDVTEAFAKACIDATFKSKLLDTIDPVLGNAIKSPESGLSAFFDRPDNVEAFNFGTSEFYLYWNILYDSNNKPEYSLLLRSTDKVLREHLKKRLMACKTNPIEKKYRIIACNDKTGGWFPDNGLVKELKEVSSRVNYLGKITSEIKIGSKTYLLVGLKSLKLRGYSFYALYPYEEIQKITLKTKSYIGIGILFFIIMAIAIGSVLSDTFLRPVNQLSEGVKAIKRRDSEFRIEALQNDEFGDLAVSFNKVISDLKEMDLAKYIQSSLLPTKAPATPGYEIAFTNRMASAVGGDYFETLMLDEENLCVIIGDVSGHGVASALVVAIAMAVLYHGFKETRDLLELFSDLNSVINTYFNKPPVKKMITLFATIINLPTGKAVYTDAGHNYPMKLKIGGQIEDIAMTGLPVGVMKKMRKQHIDEFTIEKGETIVFYTDGIIEVTGRTPEQYGYDRFKEVLSTQVANNPKETMNTLLAKYDEWQDGTEPDDDLTLIVLKRKPD